MSPPHSLLSFYRNTRWTLISRPASLRCSWTHWRSLTRELSPLTWWTARQRVQPVWCSLEKVRFLKKDKSLIQKQAFIGQLLCLAVTFSSTEGQQKPFFWLFSFRLYYFGLCPNLNLCLLLYFHYKNIKAYSRKISSVNDLFWIPEFRELQKKSEFERAEWVRKQGNRSTSLYNLTCTAVCLTLLTMHRPSLCRVPRLHCYTRMWRTLEMQGKTRYLHCIYCILKDGSLLMSFPTSDRKCQSWDWDHLV